MRRPSASLVVALLAIVIATAGTASATTALITSHQIKNGTIRLVDISKKARNALHGETGRQETRARSGTRGPPGPPGTARRPGRRRTTRDARGPGTARGSGSHRQPRPLRLHRGEEQHGRRTARESRHRGRRLPRRGAVLSGGGGASGAPIGFGGMVMGFEGPTNVNGGSNNAWEVDMVTSPASLMIHHRRRGLRRRDLRQGGFIQLEMRALDLN